MPETPAKKKKKAVVDAINLTFCSSACSAVSVGLPPPAAAADVPTGGPAEALACGGGPATEGG